MAAPPAASARPAAERLSRAVKLAYSAPSLALAGMAVPIFIYMNKFYADVVLVPLGYLALAIALARAFDALTDPFMGWLSDRSRTRWGRRRPFLLIGAPLTAVAYVALFSPPPGFSSEAAATWFALSFLLFFVFHTVYVIPHNALGPELSLDYHERSNLFGWRESFVLVGTISGALLPGVLEGVLGDARAAYAGMALLYAVLIVALTGLLLARVRERAEFSRRNPNAFVPGVRRALRNRPFRILLGSYVVGSVTAAMPGTLLPFYVAYVIRPEREVLWTTLGVVAYFLAALATISLWVRASGRIGKKPVWLTSIGLQITALAPAFFLAEGMVLTGVAVFALAGVGFGGQIVLTPSIQADVIDYDELHTGRRREAQYGALWALLPKLLAIPGAAIPLAVLGALGYRPNVAQSPDVVLAIRFFFAAVPVVFASLSLLIASRFPIDEKIHRAIRDGIARHARGEPAEDPLTGAVLPPAGEREVEEETSWLLDHHSPGELRRALRDGTPVLLRDALLAGAAALALSIGSVALALSRVGTLSDEPGPVPVIAIVVAGISLSAAVFHGLRIRPALALRRRPAKPEVLQAQLDAISRERGEPPRGGA